MHTGNTPQKHKNVRVLGADEDFVRELNLLIRAEGFHSAASLEEAAVTIADLRSPLGLADVGRPLLAIVDSELQSRNRALTLGADVTLRSNEISRIGESIRELTGSSEVGSERILLLEDCAIQREFVAKSLSSRGWQVRAAATPSEFFEELDSYSPDIVLLDYQLGGDLNGAEVCRMLRADFSWRHLPVIFMTSSESNTLDALRAGGNDVLIKGGTWVSDLAEVSCRLRQLQLERLSRLDALTGCQLRRDAILLIERLTRMSQRDGCPLSVALLDLDHFKSVNDTYGHAAGDEVLVAVARELKAFFREEDVISRWGGEEFLLATYNMEPPAAHRRLEEFAEKISKLKFDFASDYSISFTAGLASAGANGESFERTLRRLDEALYSGKNSGRGRIEIAAKQSEMELVVVEDDEDLVNLLQIEAESRGIKIRHYPDAETALKDWSKNKNVCGYLIDWNLPGISGMELINEIPLAQRENMVLMSAHFHPGVETEAQTLGFKNCLSKPKAVNNIFEYVSMEGTSSGT